MEGAGVEALFLFTVWFGLVLLLFFNKVNSKTKFPKAFPSPSCFLFTHKAHKTEVSNREKRNCSKYTRGAGAGAGSTYGRVGVEKQLGWGCPGASLAELEKEIPRPRSFKAEATWPTKEGLEDVICIEVSHVEPILLQVLPAVVSSLLLGV